LQPPESRTGSAEYNLIRAKYHHAHSDLPHPGQFLFSLRSLIY
jgi:hypothetical protein